MSRRDPRWTRIAFALAFLGFALFAAWERASFAPVFASLVPSLGATGSTAAAWAMAAASALLGLAILLGRVPDPWPSRLARWVLAAVFLAAALPKILDPAGFAQDIANYSMMPRAFVNLVAITLPWIEALTGLALLTGLLREGAVLLVNLMMVAFLLALAQAGLRGLDIDCGCFGHGAAASEPVLKALVRDLFFLGWSLPLFFTERR